MLINKRKQAFFKMKHLKAFENFDDNIDMIKNDTCCPNCNSSNILNTNGQCECIDCGESFQDGESFFNEPSNLGDDEGLDDLAQDIAAEETDSEELAMMAEDEEDYLDDHIDDMPMSPALSDDELDTYNDDSDMISSIIANAASRDQILADQLEYEAEQVDSFDEFQRVAISTIQDIEGCEYDEAVEIFDELMDSTSSTLVEKTDSRIFKFNAFQG